MYRNKHLLLSILILLIGLMILTTPGNPPDNVNAASIDALDAVDIEIEPGLLNQLSSDGSTGFLIYFRGRPDLTPAYGMDWEARGRFVVAALQEAADSSQGRVRAFLEANKITYRSFWIDNVIAVERGSNQAVFEGLLRFEEIASLRARRNLILYEPSQVTASSVVSPNAVESNIVHVGANQVWEMGYTGQGIVVANVDTGVRSTHAALVRQYRGTSTGSDDYNWLGAASGSPTPVDDNAHGSHTMGTMVGEDASQTNQIGMAPGAQWIACDACEGTGCPDTALLTCAQWIAAPYPDGKPELANPDLRPHVVNNSWGDCGQTYDGWYQSSVDTWLAAGIYPVFSNGNASNCGYSSPPGLNTVGNPARYGNVTGVGSTGNSDGVYATHSNWGPTDDPDTINPNGYPALKPQVVAPGVAIRSAYNSGDTDYGTMSGTSMSAPHVAGLVALMWSAAPCLIGDYATTETIIQDTATPIPYATGNGDEGPGDVPNHATGWGEINALAAVQEAVGRCGVIALPRSQSVCQPGEVPFDVTVGEAFSGPVDLEVLNLPAWTTAAFSVDPVLPPGTSDLTVTVPLSTAVGTYPLDVVGISSSERFTSTVSLSVFSSQPDPVSLTSPADGELNVSLQPEFRWQEVPYAESYLLQVAREADFSSLVYTATVTTNSYTSPEWLAPETSYYWRVRADNYCGPGEFSPTYTFTTRKPPLILLVDDDDNFPDVRAFYTATLDALGHRYDIWDTDYSDNEPNAQILQPYEMVIWFTGDAYGGSAGPGSAGEAALGTWLDGGKCLFLSSQDYHYDRGLTSFMTTYLGVDTVTDDKSYTTTLGSGSVFAGLGPYTLIYPVSNWSDWVTPKLGAEVAFVTRLNGAAVNYTNGKFKTTFWGFPFVSLPTEVDRQQALQAFFQWCAPYKFYFPMMNR